MKVRNPHTNEVIEIEDGSPDNMEKAQSKGYDVLVDVTNPKTGDSRTISSNDIGKAITKGWTYTEGYKQKQELLQKQDEEKKAYIEQHPSISAMQGFANVGTAGFADEIGAAINAPFSGSTYQELRDQYREGEKISADVNPKSYYGGMVAAAIPALFAGGAPQSLGQAVKTGAGIGAVSGLGSSEADLTKGEFGEAAKDTAIGGLTGAAIGGATKVAGDRVAKAFNPTELRTKVLEPGIKDRIAQATEDIRDTGKISTIGDKIEGATEGVYSKNPFEGASTREQLAKNIDNNIESLNQQSRDLIRQADLQTVAQKTEGMFPKLSARMENAGKVTMPILEKNMDKSRQIIDNLLETSQISEREATQMRGIVDEYSKKFATNLGTGKDFEYLQNQKQGLYKQLGQNPYAPGAKTSAETDALKLVANSVKTTIEDSLNSRAVSKGLGDKIKAINSEMGNNIDLFQKAVRAEARNADSAPSFNKGGIFQQAAKATLQSDSSRLIRARLGEMGLSKVAEVAEKGLVSPTSIATIENFLNAGRQSNKAENKLAEDYNKRLVELDKMAKAAYKSNQSKSQEEYYTSFIEKDATLRNLESRMANGKGK